MLRGCIGVQNEGPGWQDNILAEKHVIPDQRLFLKRDSLDQLLRGPQNQVLL
jgi:hypothetical protein